MKKSNRKYIYKINIYIRTAGTLKFEKTYYYYYYCFTAEFTRNGYYYCDIWNYKVYVYYRGHQQLDPIIIIIIRPKRANS